MLKTIRRVILGSLSLLGLSLMFWCVMFFNPCTSYANETQFDNVTVFHNDQLDESAAQVIQNAIAIIKKSDIYDEALAIQLCMNDDEVYPHLHPMLGGPNTEGPLAYALFDKTILRTCDVDFDNNLAIAQWSRNDNEIRNFNLTWLLAHEFTHNLQWKLNPMYNASSTIAGLNWKLEGHAEYVALEYKKDGRLLERTKHYLSIKDNEYKGIPVFENEYGTMQNLWYFKNSIMVQYLMEEKGLGFTEVCDLDINYDDLFSEIVEWAERS